MTAPDLENIVAGGASRPEFRSDDRPRVSIIIPVHNKSTITRQCLETLLAEPARSIDREIIVVDDGSTDATPSMLASFRERVRVIRNDTALGFAGACNAGVAAARHDLLVLLNNDTIPIEGWLQAVVAHALEHPAAAVVGVKLIFPNETIQHAGVVFGIDREPHHIYAGFPRDHPSTSISRRYQVVTAASALFRRGPWLELGGLDTDYRNGWEDVDYCMRAGEAGYEIRYCAESVVYHFESATRDLFSATERENRALFASRWRDKVVPDDFGYYQQDGLFNVIYGARCPIQISVSPLLAGVQTGENDRLADRILYDRARQVMILLRNNIVMNVRVEEAEARAADAERRLADALMRQTTTALVASTLRTSTEVPADHLDTAVALDLDEPNTEPPGLPHQIVGMVESPGRLPDIITDGVLVVSGWTLTDSGFAKVEVVVNGEPRGTITYGEPRPDAAALYPGFPAGVNCGFSGEIPVGDLPDGFYDVTIRITSTEENHAEIATTFEVDNHAFETGRVIGRIDIPVRGAWFIPRELATVTGWAMAPAGIRSLEALVDGEPRGRVDPGALRPDIGKRRRQYANADHSGFSGSAPMQGLEPGSHDLTVLVTANDGQQLELSTRIELDGTYTIDGGIPIINRHYREWLDKQAERALSTPLPAAFAGAPTSFELMAPLEDCNEAALQTLAASLRAQSHPSWLVTLVGSVNSSTGLHAAAQLVVQGDNRLSYLNIHDASPIAAMNQLMASSGADWAGVLRPTSILAPSALATIARAVAATPDATVVYSDDDRIDPDSGVRWNPFFKPDWSPDLFLALNYLGPLALFRRDRALEIGGLREEFHSAEIFDLILRLSEQPGQIVHVPEILVTTIDAAPEVDQPWHLSDWNDAQCRAVEDALRRRGIAGAGERARQPGTWRVRYDIEAAPGVTAVIPTGGKLHLLRPCLEDLLERTDYPSFEILLVDNSSDDGVERLVAEFSERHDNIRRITDNRTPFNYSALINGAIPYVTTPLILMLNDDITVIDPGWLKAMVEHGQRPEVGIVGAKLLFPDNTIQHAGVILGPFSGSIHIFKRLPGQQPGYFDLPDVVRNYSAVTFACALIDREVFTRIGGLDEERLPIAFNDTDFCLRAREAGFEVIYTPHAELYHHESVTKTVIANPGEIGYLRERWGHVIAHDPYYNPNLTRTGEDARLNMGVIGAG